MPESDILFDKHVLICFHVDSQLDETLNDRLEKIKRLFCGKVVSDANAEHVHEKIVRTYLCGDVKSFYDQLNVDQDEHIFIVEEFSYDYQEHKANLISSGEIPLSINGVGVFFQKFFRDADKSYFEQLQSCHDFQQLTESDKPSMSFRQGIYLSEVETSGDETDFNLLRCSTNFTGPTDSFKNIDHDIVDRVNDTVDTLFHQPAKLNHVLAQIYNNISAIPDTTSKDKKAKIKSHADKTEDMPDNGLIAFCTFYSKDIDEKSKQSKDDPYDRVYKNCSVLTKLRFRLKESVKDNDLEKIFTITLYPDSMFVIPLSTNRLYTHEVVPSSLQVDKIPTRLGYVIRCSHTRAVHRDGITYIRTGDKKTKLEQSTEADRAKLKQLYQQENMTHDVLEYGDLLFSLNAGDYKKPLT